MSRIIYKYPLDLAKEQEIGLYRVRQLLCVQLQNGMPTLWASVNPDTQPANVLIRCYGTGDGYPNPDEKYLGTVQLDGFVWHYFEADQE